MFSRRSKRNSTSRGRAGVPASPAATTAAAQAFLANRISNANLAGAAATAALRSQTTTPTPVGEIQTKRMLQRQSSVSSNGSAPGSRQGLQRRGSSGSMTERSFRDSLPNRPVSRSNEDHPPLPPLPKKYAAPPIPAKSAQRPTSVEPPERISSPPPKASGGRVTSLDRGPGMIEGTNLSKQPKRLNTGMGNFVEEALGKRSSINFSRPMSPQNSPPTTPLRAVPPPNFAQKNFYASSANSATPAPSTPSAISANERSNIEYSMQEASTTPIKKKKKKKVMVAEGSYLNLGTSGARPTGSAVQNTTPGRPIPASTISIATPPSQSHETGPRLLPKKKKVSSPPTSSAEYTSDSDNGSESSYSSDRPKSFNTRAAGLLTKQPSIVREDPEAEEQGELLTSSKYQNPIQNGTLRSLAEMPSQAPKPGPLSATTSIPLDDESIEPLTKRNSLSPARATHFSSQPTYDTPEATKHEPPARSLSPAKSALKLSPSSRGTSPANIASGWNKPGHTPSEASDNTSVVSDEGSRSLPKKRAKVSFDDDPSVLGQAATPPTSHDSPTSSSQTIEPSKRAFFGIGRDKKKTQSPIDMEADDTIKPVPVLPFFGSVRGRKESHETPGASTDPSLESEECRDHTGNLGTSNDQVVGGILVNDFATKGRQAANHSSKDPLAPEVTSVEGSGYHSDSEASLFGDEDRNKPSIRLKNELPTSVDGAESSFVPIIAVQPATPGIDEAPQSKSTWPGIPGDLPPSSEHPDQDAQDIAMPDHHESHVTQVTPSTVGIAEPQPEAAAAYHEPGSPVLGEIAENIRQQTAPHDEKDSDTGDSIYSDAAEEVSDGDGFGSINAIVESPTGPKAIPFEKSNPVSPSRASFKKDEPTTEAPDTEPEAGWDQEQAYWSSLSQSRKTELEAKATSPENANTSQPAMKPKKKKAISQNMSQPPQLTPLDTQMRSTTKPMSSAPQQKTAKRAAASDVSKTPQLRSSMRAAPVATVDPSNLRSSMRIGPAATVEPTRIRSSMRSTPAASAEPTRIRSSMRKTTPTSTQMQNTARPASVASPSPEPKGTLQKKGRPVSAVATVDYTKRNAGGANHSRAVSGSSALAPTTASPPRKTQPPKPLHRSDSDSSFKKARPTPPTERYAMKRSMRGSSVNERPRSEYAQSSRFGVRSLSPQNDSRPPFSMKSGMRSSMRESIDSSREKSPSRSLGFGRAKSPTGSFAFGRGLRSKPEPANTASKSRFSSRFNNSSDEDDGPTTYRSRFADSSDEDEAPTLPKDFRPVRGIPKRIDEGDSTDLEDSADERNKVPKTPTKPPPISTNLEGNALAAGSLRPSTSGRGMLSPTSVKSPTTPEEKKKRSFFGALGRRKDKSKVLKSDAESAARRDTPLERSKHERSNLPDGENLTPVVTKNNTSVESPTASPRSPKLQRRMTPKRYASDSWPLALAAGQSSDAAGPERPKTSDGVGAAKRPMTGRTNSFQTDGVNGVPLGRTGKKKRFPMLRKAFGLHD